MRASGTVSTRSLAFRSNVFSSTGLSQPKRCAHTPRERSSGVLTRAFFGGLFGGGKKDDGAQPPKKGGMKPVARNCSTCKNTGGISCKGCNGTGRNKKNGNAMERYKCFDCQGFGLVPCRACGKGGRGLTPEQSGER